jgi:ribosome modulation factor
MREAYKSGYDAYLDGNCQSKCPFSYERENDLYEDWNRGWERAQQDKFDFDKPDFIETCINSMPRV